MDYSETCLSDSVRKYFLQVPSSTTSLNKEETFLLDKLEIDFGRILEIINTEGNITETEAALKIIPILSQIHQQFLTADIEYPEISGYLDWVSQPDHCSFCWELLRQNRQEDSLDMLLVLTPLLERSLGNLLISLKPSLKVPALLKDLLKMTELSELLGSPCIFVMRQWKIIYKHSHKMTYFYHDPLIIILRHHVVSCKRNYLTYAEGCCWDLLSPSTSGTLSGTASSSLEKSLSALSLSSSSCCPLWEPSFSGMDFQSEKENSSHFPGLESSRRIILWKLYLSKNLSFKRRTPFCFTRKTSQLLLDCLATLKLRDTTWPASSSFPC